MSDLGGKIAGIGVDLCGVARIEKALLQERFAQRVYTEQERAYLLAQGKAHVQSAAAMFAAKEAVAKALGTGFSQGIAMAQIEVTHEANGAPGVRLSGAAQARLQAIGGKRVLLSLSHEKDMAAAFAVIEAGGDEP